MRPLLGPIRDRLVNRTLGIDVRGTQAEIRQVLSDNAERHENNDAWQAHVALLHEKCDDLRQEVVTGQVAAAQWRSSAEALQNEASEQMAFIARRLGVQLQVLKDDRDNIPWLEAQLGVMRQTEAYKRVHDIREPLVSVRIASYEKTTELIDVAIASILRQSYDNFEVVIVNDGPNDRTRRAVSGLRDSRIRYSELPARSRYPVDPQSRWMVAGSPAMNRASELSTGTWIAPLDDDDEFSSDHIEKLVALGQRSQVELAYGALVQKHLIHSTEKRIWSSPPAISEFSFQGAIYLRMMDFFEYDEASWMVEEPSDWNLIRRMTAAGVKMSATEDIVATMHMVPYTLKALE